MSENQFIQFLAKVKEDPALRESLKNETDVFAAGAKAGFSFTQEDVDAVTASIDEDQLASVSGGGVGQDLGYFAAGVGTLGILPAVDALANDSKIYKWMGS